MRVVSFAWLAVVSACSSSGADGTTGPSPDASNTSTDGGLPPDGQDARSDARGQTREAAGACPTPAIPATNASAVTFTVRNTGTGPIELPLGCGSLLPIDLVDDAGRSLSIEGADSCGFNCANGYAGQQRGACSDCGVDQTATVAPGATTTLSWNRLVYHDETVPAECSDSGLSSTCALGEVLTGTVWPAALSFCYDLPGVGCTKVPFMIDLSRDAMAIDVP